MPERSRTKLPIDTIANKKNRRCAYVSVVKCRNKFLNTTFFNISLAI